MIVRYEAHKYMLEILLYEVEQYGLGPCNGLNSLSLAQGQCV